MNRIQRDNLYIVGMKRLLIDGAETLDLDNGDFVRIKASEEKLTTGFPKSVELPSFALQVAMANLEGDVTYLGTYHKVLENNQTIEDILMSSPIEKINFILKKETGLIKGSPYHLIESYGGKITKDASDALEQDATLILSKFKEQIKKEKQKEVEESHTNHKK